MTKAQLNAGLFALTLVSAVICYSFGEVEGAKLLLATVTGWVLTSPFQKADK